MLISFKYFFTSFFIFVYAVGKFLSTFTTVRIVISYDRSASCVGNVFFCFSAFTHQEPFVYGLNSASLLNEFAPMRTAAFSAKEIFSFVSVSNTAFFAFPTLGHTPLRRRLA